MNPNSPRSRGVAQHLPGTLDAKVGGMRGHVGIDYGGGEIDRLTTCPPTALDEMVEQSFGGARPIGPNCRLVGDRASGCISPAGGPMPPGRFYDPDLRGVRDQVGVVVRSRRPIPSHNPGAPLPIPLDQVGDDLDRRHRRVGALQSQPHEFAAEDTKSLLAPGPLSLTRGDAVSVKSASLPIATPRALTPISCPQHQ